MLEKDMDWSFILGLIGTIATIVFGFLSIDLFKRKKYPGKVTYIELSLIDLLNNVANNFKEIELLHNKMPINKNIIYLKGALLNNGDIDINSKLTEKDITIELPFGCKWLDIKVTSSSDGLNSDVNIIEDKKAAFKFDLFRRNEFIQFEGLIESDSNKISSDVLNSDLSFTHRIENTSRIDKKVILTENEIKRKKKSAFTLSIAILMILVVLTATNVFNVLGSKKESLFYQKIGDKSNVIYSCKQNEGLIYLTSYNGGNDSVSSYEEFNKNYKVSNIELTFWQKFKESYWVISIQIGLFLVMVLWELLEIRKAKKLSNIFRN